MGRPGFKPGETRTTGLVGSTPTLFRQCSLREGHPSRLLRYDATKSQTTMAWHWQHEVPPDPDQPTASRIRSAVSFSRGGRHAYGSHVALRSDGMDGVSAIPRRKASTSRL